VENPCLMLFIKHAISDAFQLFFPHYCLGCGSDLLADTNLLCMRCISILPHTGYETIENNPVENIFRGRVNLRAASSQFYFSKGQLVQALIHQLKYKGNIALGEWMGKVMGRSLLESGRFSNIDYLVPLPLYADKEFKRGFNQAEVICRGMAHVMQIPLLDKQVIRQRSTETQTRKHRAERWENVDGSFAVKNAPLLHGKNILLVDDVITTGATLEACAQSLIKVPGVQVSLATVAIASK
jgi:ComF family protein